MTNPTGSTTPPAPPNPSTTSTGMKENVAGVLCYVLGWVTGVIFLLIEPNNKFVKFHAIQSIIFFGAVTVIDIVIGWIPFIGWIIAWIIGVIAFIFWIIFMVNASQGKLYKAPWVGNYAEKYTNR
jgi:uncharacterized membrane protein